MCMSFDIEVHVFIFSIRSHNRYLLHLKFCDSRNYLQGKMMMWIITLIITNFIIKAYAPDPVTWNNEEIVTIEHAEGVLAKIRLDEALPVVFFLMNEGTEGEKLENPDDIVKAVLVNGKMVSGTEFHQIDSEKQIFFCPKQNSPEICLAPQKFENGDRLQCAEQPTPDVIQHLRPNKCGIQTAGISYAVIYHVCPAENPYRYMDSELVIYLFCYDGPNQKVLFTTHSILSTKLLDSKLLYREQKLIYPYKYDLRFPTENYTTIINANIGESNPSFLQSRPKYKVQTLVPSGDMPFGIWKKTINQYFNFELQHKSIFDFWNLINEHVRKSAIKYANSECRFVIRTGVFHNEAGVRNGTKQIYNRWVKMIIAVTKDQVEFAGVVFIMDNFLLSEANRLTKQKLIEDMKKYGEEDFCNIDFAVDVRKAGGGLKCYRVIPAIKHLFGLDGGDILPLLDIDRVTFNYNDYD